MDSQLTLVNAVSPVDLVFERDSMLNNVLSVNSKPLYTISTTDLDGTHTKIKNLQNGRSLVEIQLRTFFSDTVKFVDRNGGETVKVKNWLKEIKPAVKLPSWTLESASGTYVWKAGVEHRLALFAENNTEKPVAYMDAKTPTTPMTLTLESVTEGFRDEILASFIILEQRFRMIERTIIRGDGMVAANRTMLGYTVDTGRH